ncbi:phage holin family protein [Patescibacteria group bacterium]|nr:phage holin family protein [Patescibacteria group bacterium]
MFPTLIMAADPAALAPDVTATIPIGEALNFVTAFGTFQIRTIAVLLAVDIILGMAAALAQKTFNFNKVAAFMKNGVIPYLLGFAVVQLVIAGIGFYAAIVTFIVFVLVVINILASIISNLASLGVSMPSVLKKK